MIDTLARQAPHPMPRDPFERRQDSRAFEVGAFLALAILFALALVH